MIAQLLAIGMKPKDVALKTGYSVSRISILQLDPAFKELLANYTAEQDNLTVDIKERLRHLSMDSIDVIQARFDDDPTQFSNKELFDLAELTLDRTGHGKTATVQHSYGIDPETAELLRQNRSRPQIANLLEGELIDAERISGRAAFGDESLEARTAGSEIYGKSVEPGKAEPRQLDFFSGEDQAAGGTEISEVPFGTPENYPEGQAEPDSAVGTELSEEVREVVAEGNIVPFQRTPPRIGHPL
jgi:hypothetical protein